MTKQIFAIFFACALFSCTNNRTSSNAATPKQDTCVPPKVTILANLPDSLQPKIVLLDTMPQPRMIAVPKHKGGSYPTTLDNGQRQTINLEPPVITPLPVLLGANGKPIKDSAGNTFVAGYGGKSNFTTLTTDKGLALDAINCSKMDKWGNLWFGTYGGGVSRYDGKSFTTFSTTQGLANNNVFSIAEDRAGNLWFGTNGGGVSRYDGKCFTTFSKAQGLANNIVYSIAVDKQGNLWFGTAGGVSRFDPTGKRGMGAKSFTTFTTDSGLAHNKVGSIAEDKAGNLWFGTFGGGVSRYDPTGKSGTGLKAFTTFSTNQGLANNRVFCIAVDKMGMLWLGTEGGGVVRFDPTGKTGTGSAAFTTFNTAQGLANNNIRSIAEDKTGNLWFATDGGGVSRYDAAGKTGTGSTAFTTFTTAQGLANNIVYSITEDKVGNLWFGTFGGGLSIYEGESFTTFTTTHGLANNGVITIAEDKTEHLWFGTLGGGISRYDPSRKSGTASKSFTTFSTAQGLANNNVWSIAEDKTGSLWFGTDGGGVSRYDGQSFTTFSTAQGLGNNIVQNIVEDKTGNLWFGTNGGGVSCYDPAGKRGGSKSLTTFSTAQGLANNNVWSIAEDKTGSIWFGTDGGVSRYGPAEKNGGSMSFISFSTAQGLANNTVLCVAEDKTGNLWFGTVNGLSVMSVNQVEKLRSYTETTVGIQEKKDLAKQENRAGRQIFRTFTKTEGLPDNFVTQILQLPNGKMAVGTNSGIILFRPTADFTALNDIEIYNTNTGCPVKDVNVGQNCMFLDSKGVIWAGTGNERTALVRFDPSAVLRTKEPPTIVINGIKINEAAICWNDLLRAKSGGQGAKADSNVTPAYITEEVMTFGHTLAEQERDSVRHRFGKIRFDSIRRFYTVPEGLVLPYAHNHVTIDFNAIETGKPKLVNYQYMLVGYDNDWSPIGKNTIAAFGNIREGNYTFKVKAQSPDGVWCAPVTYTFKVLPPWYRTWWAYLTYTLLSLLALRLFSKMRERKLRLEKAKLEKTVVERTAVVEQQKEELVQKNIIVESQKATVEKEKQRSEELLLNILPEEVAEELKVNGTSAAKHFDNVTVLFTDFVGFSTASERMTPQELVNELHECFRAFDGIMGKYNIEKIKTVGDAYLAVCGLPNATPEHAEHIVNAALEIRDFMSARYAALGDKTFQIRIGVHSGPVVAGIVGVKKFAYDIWGDTVNTAARMEQNSEAGKINISQATYELVKDQFSCTYRGEIAAKNKGMLRMYFVG